VNNVLLDTNVYDDLQSDEEVRTRLASLVSEKQIRVIATPKIEDELRAGPLGGLPDDWFPIDLQEESVAVIGHARVGMARLGAGEVFRRHRGASTQIPDAIIADSADSQADIAVSNDRRFVTRLNKHSERRCSAMSYSVFRAWLLAQPLRSERQR